MTRVDDVLSRMARLDARVTRCQVCDVWVLPNVGDPAVCDTCAARALIVRVRAAS